MKHTLVIGGTRGIGRVIALKMTEPEMWVSVVGRITETWQQKIEQHGPLTNLIFSQRWREEKADPWKGEIETGLTLTRDTIEHYCDGIYDIRGLSIVIISSLCSTSIADEQNVGYHTTKGGLDNLIRYYCVKLGPYGVRVNGVCPGVCRKPENKEYYDEHPEKVRLFSELNPIGRMVTAEDVAETVWAICYHMPAVTGEIIKVDGGVSKLNVESVARRYLKEGNRT